MYPWIEAALPRDLALLRRGLKRLTRGADDFERLFEEFAEGLHAELDFEREARSANAIAANLAKHTAVIVPTVFASHSTRRVLTMSRHEGLRIDDRAGLIARGIDPRRVVEILARAYGQQIFEDGLFHADPHPGNLFVLQSNDREPRVLFVDFGLCKQLDDKLRRAMRAAILALLQRDARSFVDHMEQMGMLAAGARAEVERRVEAMFERIADEGGALALSGGQVLGIKDEAKRLLSETPGLQLPNDLLLYAKTLSYLFALCERLEPDADVMKLSIPYLLKLLAHRTEPKPGPELRN
jgi:ubiquinone biosynthesis protein